MKAKRNPKVSIIMATHLRPKLLARAISSVRAQAYAEIELIVVSDCICRETDEVASTLLADNDVYVRRNGPPGPAYSRNLAQKLASGDYFLFLDDDDTLAPHFLPSMLQHVVKHPHSVLYCDFYVINEEVSADGDMVESSREYVSLAGRSVADLYVKNFIPNSCLVYPRVCLKEHWTDTNLKSIEDWDYLLSVLSRHDLVHCPLGGPQIHKRAGAPDSRGRSADAQNEMLLSDYLHIYKKWPIADEAVREQRHKLLSQVFPGVLPNRWV